MPSKTKLKNAAIAAKPASCDIPGLWIEGTEGAKSWMKVLNDLRTRGVGDILIAVTDGLKGMPEALQAPASWLGGNNLLQLNS